MEGLSLRGISKYYASSDTQANDGASLEVARGSIHALVGENGAGKTTLMRILYGLERADAGEIQLDGKPVRIARPQDAARLGIGMVHQHFMTVDDFTVMENVVLGREPKAAGLFFDPGAALTKVRAVMERHSLVLDPKRKAGSLSVGERQTLEILRLLYREADILILDEPTAVLTEQEIRALFATLRELRASGHTIVIITHKVREVKEISDFVTVMRQGRTVESLRTADVTEYDLSCLIMGTARCPDFSRGRSPAWKDEPALVVQNLSLKARRSGVRLLDSIDLAIRPGEILGLCGVRGNGTGELEDVLGGFCAPDSGRILVGGQPLPVWRRPARSGHGLGYVPSDRMRRGSSPGLPVADNYIALDRRHYARRGIMDRAMAAQATDAAIARFGIKATASRPAGELSGGNIQKLILARELSTPPPAVILCADPTWGLDIASTESIYAKILEARDAGSAILLISSNLDEIISLSDRVAVMYRGRIVCTLDNDGSLGRELLGSWMLGLGGAGAEAEGTKNASQAPEEAGHGS